MPESEHAAGSWLGDLTNEWKQAKPPEKVLIVGAVVAVGGIAFYLYKKQNAAGTVNAPGQGSDQGQAGQQVGFPTIPAGETPVLPAGIGPIFDPNGNLIGYGPTPPSGTTPPNTGNPPAGTGSSGTGTGGTKPPPKHHHHKHHHKHHDNGTVVAHAASQTNARRRPMPPQPVHKKPIIPPRRANQGPGHMPPHAKPPQPVGPPVKGPR